MILILLSVNCQIFSKQEYQHARRVSRLAASCARVAGADEKTCAAAGFYYRIGIMEGEPLTESGIRIAQEHRFPEDVIRIISEYDGETAPPSSIESAIVHIGKWPGQKIEVLTIIQWQANGIRIWSSTRH